MAENTSVEDSVNSKEDLGIGESIYSKPAVATYTRCTPEKLSGLERDIWDVKKLKPHIEPVQNSELSAPICRMMDLRKKRHELSNSNMWKDIGRVNETTEKYFTKISDNFKRLLESIKIALTTLEKAILDQEHVILYRKEDFIQAMSKAKEIFTFRRNIIDIYCKEVMEVEKTRSEKIKLVLRFYMNSFHKISHQMPRDIQSFFEHQILRYNESMMENVRCYEEIRLQLLMSGERQFLKLKRKIEYLEDQWECHKKKPKRRMSEFSEGRRRYSGANATLTADESDEIRCLLHGDSLSHMLFQGVVCRWAGAPDIPHVKFSINEWSEQLLRILMHLDLCAQKIISRTKNALVNLLKGLKLDFEALQFSLLAEDFYKATNIHDVHLISGAIIAKLKAKTLFEPEKYMDVIHNYFLCQDGFSLKSVLLEAYDVQNLILLMEHNNDITKGFLSNSAKLWNSHFCRMNKCSNLVACGVNRLNEDRKEIDGLEILFNTELDRLRQESEIDKLDGALKNVYHCLDKIQSYYEAACDAEKEILKNYPQLMATELDVFKAEIEQFCVDHPKVEVSVELHFSQEENLTVEADQRKVDKVPQQIRTCIFQLEAIENWKLGLFECMEHYTSTCKDDFLIEWESWVSEMVKLSVNRMETKKKFLAPRYERVLIEVHNVRLLELQQHRGSLEAHQLAVEDYLKEITDEMGKFVFDQIKHAEDLVIQLKEFISERDINALVSNQVSYLLRKTDMDIEKCISKINGCILDMQEDCSTKVKWLKQSTINFLKSIKMFSEGGNFSAAEVKVFVPELIKAEKFVDSQGGLTQSKIAAEGAALLAKVRDMLDGSRRKLKNLYGDLILIEKTTIKINLLKEKMEKEVSFMKKGHEILKKKQEEIETTLTDAPYPIEAEKWNELVDALQQRSAYLLKSADSQAKLTTVSLGQKSTTPSSSDYRYFLGWDKPTDSDTFLDRVRLNLWDIFGEIQVLATNYYSSKSEKNIVKTDIIPPNFRNFMEELLEKCKFYLIQCEEAWLDQLQEYLILVTKTREMANTFTKLAIEGFGTNQVGKLQAVRSEFLSNFAIKSHDQANQLAEMDRRLMPLFGYPGNRKMLADLNAVVMKSFENLVSSTLEDFFAHRENLKVTHSTYQPSLNDVLAEISEFCEKVFDHSLSEKVALQLEEICEDSLKIIEMDHIQEKRPLSSVSKKTEESTSSFDKISLMEVPSDTVIRKEIPEKYKLHFKYNSLPVKRICRALKNILNRNLYVNKEAETEPHGTTTSLNELSDKNSGVDLQVHVNSEASLQAHKSDYEIGIHFVRRYDVDEIIAFATNEYTTKYNDCFHKLTIDIIDFKTSSKEWLKKWKENVKQVQKLYTVSYDSEKPLESI